MKIALIAASSTLLLTGLLQAQDASPAPSATATPAPTAASSPDPRADFRQRMNDRMKAALKASDDEWAVIQPLLEKVQEAQRATRGGFGGPGMFGGPGGFGRGPGGPGGPGGPDGAPPTASGSNAQPGPSGPGGPGGRQGRFFRPSSPEAEALQTALQSDGTADSDIKAKLDALRAARKKAAADLEDARQNLEKVLTLRQEATLVEMGVLE